MAVLRSDDLPESAIRCPDGVASRPKPAPYAETKDSLTIGARPHTTCPALPSVSALRDGPDHETWIAGADRTMPITCFGASTSSNPN